MNRQCVWFGLTLLGLWLVVTSVGGEQDLCSPECNDNTTTALDVQVLIRNKRDFGGKEPINWPLTYNAVFGVPGWLAQACEAFSDINFHLLGYNVLGKVLSQGLP
jgi:hypothetical protein